MDNKVNNENKIEYNQQKEKIDKDISDEKISLKDEKYLGISNTEKKCCPNLNSFSLFKLFFSLIFIFILIRFVKYILKEYTINHDINDNIYSFNITDEKEIQKAKNYYDLCTAGTLLKQINLSNKKISDKPKISIIIPVYNNHQFLLGSLRSIQNQPFIETEIVYIDDCSIDKSVDLINTFRKEDKRIILIKNDINKGTLFSRNAGALLSKGGHIMFLDPDDILLENILSISYRFAKSEEKEYDIIQFLSYKKNEDKIFPWLNFIRKKRIIMQPTLSYIMFYDEEGNVNKNNFYLWGKLIKQRTFISTINSISSNYTNQHMSYLEDGLMLFALLKKAESFRQILTFGYLYLENDMGVLKRRNNKERINKTIRDYLTFIKFIFQNTKNEPSDRSISVYNIQQFFLRYNSTIETITEGFDVINEVYNLFIKCQFVPNEIKLIMKNQLESLNKAKDEI